MRSRLAVASEDGGDSTGALLDGGGLRCWGYGLLGRHIGDDEIPASVGEVAYQ